MLSGDKEECLYHSALILSKKVGVGSVSADRKLSELLRKYGSLRSVFNSERDLFDGSVYDVPGIDRVVAELEACPDFSTLTVCDDGFPLESGPPVLYVRGNTSLLDKNTIAVVGTRKPDDIDVRNGRIVLERLVAKNYVIVSGLAGGCDALAHAAAIEFGGETVAVLGTPINKYSRKDTAELQDVIAERHLLVSQYPVGITTFPSHFAYRNGVTVGLSKDGVVVIRAGDKSGTMHAVRHCMRAGKPLYVLKNNFGKGYKWLERAVSSYADKLKVPDK